jgi:translocation and assembly module TamB
MKIIKFFFKIFVIILLISLLFWGGILALLHTQEGKQWIFQHLLAYVERKTQTEIDLESFSITFPLQFTLKNLSIKKEKKPVVALDSAEMTCSFSHLLHGRLIISSLHINQLHLFSLPTTEQPSPPSAEPLSLADEEMESAIDWDHPQFSFYAKISDLQINRIVIAPALLEEREIPVPLLKLLADSSLSLEGTATSNPFRMGLVSALTFTLTPADPLFPPVKLELATQHHQLQLNLAWSRCCQSVLKDLLDPTTALHWPDAVEAGLTLSTSGPLTSWRSLVQSHQLKGDQSIEGTCEVSLAASPDDLLYHPLIGSHSVMKAHFILNSEFLIKFIDVNFISPIVTAQGHTALSVNKEIQQGALIASFHSIEPFSPFFKIPLQGKLTLDGEFKGPLDSPAILFSITSPAIGIDRHLFENADLTLEANDVPHGDIEGTAHLLFHFRQQPVEALTSFTINPTTEQVTLSSLKANLFNIKTTGELTFHLPDKLLSGTLHADNADFNALSSFLNTPLQGEGEFNFQFSTKEGFDFKLTGKNWKREGCEAEAVFAHIRAGSPLFNTTELQIHSTLKAQGILCQNNKIDTKIYIASIESTHLTNLLGPTFTNLSSQWLAEKIQWNTIHIAKADGRVEMPDPLSHFQGVVEANLHNLLIGESGWDTISGRTEFSPNQTLWPFHLEGTGFWKEDALFTVNGDWHNETDHGWFIINQLEGRLGPYPFKNLSPIEYSEEAHQTQLTGFHLKLNEGEFQGSYRSKGDEFVMDFETNPLPTELLHFIAPEVPLTGRTSFAGNLKGTLENATGELRVRLHHVQLTEEILQQRPFIDGDIALKLGADGISLQSELKGIGSTPFIIDGHLPYTIGLIPFQFRKESALPFHIAMNAEGELAPYMSLFLSDATNITGKAKIALEIDGDIGAPEVKGSIALSEGSYESFSTDTIYHHIQGRLEGNGKQIILSEFSAQDNKNGSFSASGTISLSPSENFPLSFELHPKQIFIIDSDYASISASGQLTLDGTLLQATLAGNLTVDKGLIKLEESLPRSIKTVEVKYFNLPEGEEPPIPVTNQESSSSLHLDIELDVPDHFEIQGNRLNSVWKGEVHISGTPNDPLLNGELRIVNGDYNFNGKLFTLNPGSIHFGGSLDKKTTLYIVASQEIDRIRAEIILKGPINKPVISFRSNPPLSQREVLSYILFNRGISDITADQGEQLSQSFIALNTSDQTNAGDDFLSRMRNKIGLDRLDFSTGSQENQNFSLQLGKNITENIFISLNQSLVSAVPFLSVEIKLNKHLRLQADGGNVGDDNQFRTSLKWKKDY